MHSKYDNIHKNRIIYVLKCTNNHVISSINCRLSRGEIESTRWSKREIEEQERDEIEGEILMGGESP